MDRIGSIAIFFILRTANAATVRKFRKGEVAMRVFITGASGFIGTAIVQELVGAGHQVLGLARSDASAKSLVALGAQVHQGNLDDLESLRSGAAKSDAVIHCAFNHDFSQYQANCEADRRVIEAMGSVLIGSDRPFVVSAGVGVDTPGRAATENDACMPSSILPRSASEEAALSLAERGVRASVVRLPQVHNLDMQGLITLLVIIAREKRVSAYVGDGANRWPAAHRLDVGHLYTLALEKGSAGARYHAIAEEGVPLRQIAEVIGRRLKLPVVSKSPEEAADHFGWMGFMVGRDGVASSAITRERLGWRPTGPSLIADLERAHNLEI
jgi:nucleoside-diphosphate-sugar epimerase